MSGRRLIVTTLDLPYPPNYGHKVDQFNRWKGFAEAGWKLRLICWKSPIDPEGAPGDLDALRSIFESIEVIPIGHDTGSFLRRLVRLPLYPSHVSARIPDRVTLNRLTAEAKAFAPDAVVNDGIYGGFLGNHLARACGVPAILRGHNVEFRYFAQQSRLARSTKARITTTLARLGLKRWEDRMTRESAWSFQISADDFDYWRGQGVQNLSWAPTVYPGSAHGTLIPATERQFDVGYIGNMRLPNNLAGLIWFVNEVLPILRQLRPGVTLRFAGANPSQEALALFATAPDIVLVPNAPSADEILAQSRVLVNPILSGSGVNVKSIDMLRYDAPIVTTRIGVQGFPADMQDQFVVRDDAAGFAKAIAESLADPVAPAGRAEARAVFGQTGLNAQIAEYQRLLRQG